MNRYRFFIICILLLSCRAKEKFLEPEFVLNKWAKATQTLNYTDYQKSEAFPKKPDVFREMYQEYYLADMSVGKIEDFDRKKIHKDIDGNQYYGRDVIFQCAEINRKIGKPVNLLKGSVIFIKYIDGPRKGESWLMMNRTLIRVKI